MKVGTICYASEQGIGRLAKSFYDAEVITDPYVITHSSRLSHPEWYGWSERTILDRFDPEVARDHCRSCEVMLFIETPFDWDLIPYCKKYGVKTVVMPIHECFPAHLLNGTAYKPDLFLCPSLLELRVFQPHGPSIYIPTPVEGVPWKKRTRAEVFVHNAGHGGLKGRNGTAELLAAIPYVKSDALFLVRAQDAIQGVDQPASKLTQVRFQWGTYPYESLFTYGDVFVFPEKFQGQSCPLEEARAAGMLVMGTNRFPINQWLPTEPLIQPFETRKNRVGPAYLEFDEAIHDPKKIAAKIDEWYGKDISEYSLQGVEFAESRSWKNLKPHYMQALKGL